MSEHGQLTDTQGHKLGCLHYSNDNAPMAHPNSTHIDIFCDCHDWQKPRILANGSDVAWPAGWTEQMATDWRLKNNLARPSEPGSGP